MLFWWIPMSKFTARPLFPNSNNNKRLEKVAAVAVVVDAAVGGDELEEQLLLDILQKTMHLVCVFLLAYFWGNVSLYAGSAESALDVLQFFSLFQQARIS
jgi:hypothetical protein